MIFLFMNLPAQTEHSSLTTPAGSRGVKITLTDSGKRFNREWIFRHLSYNFVPGISYAITGPNGSGKSTLLQAIAGNMELSEGAIEYQLNSRARNKEQGTGEDAGDVQVVLPEDHFQHIAIVAPYLELVEEMTAKEFLHFHNQFKSLFSHVSVEQILSIVGLEKAINKQVRYFSSGMKQRLKLAQAVFADVPVLLLDEPCTNLDAAGYELYHRLIEQYCSGKLIIVSSNDVQEMDFCVEKVSILDYK
jgi:ABC-type multidrug transport system ATPase subunit